MLTGMIEDDWSIVLEINLCTSGGSLRSLARCASAT